MHEVGCIVASYWITKGQPQLTVLGMAVRLSADLGLHLDLNEQYQSGMLSQRDIGVRRTTFWGVFIHDKFVPGVFQL
jgi:Fungal specific transcription factor domain